MLMPKKTKFRKQMRGRMRGDAHTGNSISFEILNVGEDESFETHEGALSDHPALFIKFEIIKI